MTTTETPKKILVVEDNERYMEAALKALSQQPGVWPYFAEDYGKAVFGFEEQKYVGVLTDLFFAQSAGSDNRSLGNSLVDVLAQEDINEQRSRAWIEKVSQYAPMDDDLRARLEHMSAQTSTNPEDSPVYRAIRQVAGVIGPNELVAHIIKRTLPLPRAARKNPYLVLREAIERDPAQQPLGILVAERAKNKGIPCVIVTSTYHHDTITQPLIDYATRKQLGPVLDCPRENPGYKADPVFWTHAYKQLEHLMHAGGNA